MVVGTGAYQDRNEAYPLDKKTLRTIALRSLFSGSSFNGETAQSIGWLWAIEPGLRKIHTNETDLALSMGHNLEYVNGGGFFSSLAMGITLALEQQKADLETIRSVRTAAAAAAKAAGDSLFYYLVFPLAFAVVTSMVNGGNIAGVIIYFVLTCLAAAAARIGLMYYGYAKGTRAVEILNRNGEALKNASRLSGLMIIGSLAVYAFDSSLMTLGLPAGETLGAAVSRIMPGALPLLVLWLCWHLLTKKNKSLGTCVLIILLAVLAAGLLGVFGVSLL